MMNEYGVRRAWKYLSIELLLILPGLMVVLWGGVSIDAGLGWITPQLSLRLPLYVGGMILSSGVILALLEQFNPNESGGRRMVVRMAICFLGGLALDHNPGGMVAGFLVNNVMWIMAESQWKTRCEEENMTGMLGGGLALYPVVMGVFSLNADTRPLRPILVVCGVVAYSIALWQLNGLNLKSVSRIGDRQPRIPQFTGRMNRRLVLLVFFVMMAIATGTAADGIAGAAGWLLRNMLLGIMSFLAWLASLMPVSSEVMKNEGDMPMLTQGAIDFEANTKTSDWQLPDLTPSPELLQAISNGARVLAWLIPLALVVGACWILLRIRSAQAQTQGETDERESIQLPSFQLRAGERLKAWMDAHARYGSMKDNASRARWLYRKTVQKAAQSGMTLESSHTAREELDRASRLEHAPVIHAEPVASVYETARYAMREPTDEEIRRMLADLAVDGVQSVSEIPSQDGQGRKEE